MTHTHYIQKLFDETIDVDWIPLGDVIVSLLSGRNPHTGFALNTHDADYYYITVKEMQNGKIVFTDKTDRINQQAIDFINKKSNIEIGDILFSRNAIVGRTALIVENPDNWDINNDICAIKPKQDIINSKYLSHILNARDIVNAYSKYIVGSIISRLKISELKKLPIPIPCADNPQKSLMIQNKIANILDKLHKLKDALKDELNARKKQYIYYRDDLLTFSDDVEFVPLGELATLKRGNSTLSQKYVDDNPGQYPVYSAKKTKNGIIGCIDTYDFDGECVMCIIGGIHSGSSHYISGKCSMTSSCCLITINDTSQLNYRFLNHWLAITAPNHVNTTMGIAIISIYNMQNIPIPIPPLAEQERIANILDKLYDLTTSITHGLPGEIELLEKQYAYYRNELLAWSRVEMCNKYAKNA